LLEKLAQEDTTSVSGSPVPVNIYDLNRNLIVGYSNNANIIRELNELCQLLNNAIFYSSNGQMEINRVNFEPLYTNISSSSDLKSY
jgi:hypothetical protein